MTYLSSYVYSFFSIDEAGNLNYIGFCTEAEFDDYLDELLEGHSIENLNWNMELYEDEFPD